jgi:hypothetical protein
MLIKEDNIKKNKCQKHKSTIKRMLSKSPKNKFFKIKEKFQDFELEKLLWEPHSPTNKHKKRKSIDNKKTKKSRIEKKNIDISVHSITSVDSKLFNNNKDYENYKKLISKDIDYSLIKEIIFELDVNKK